MTKLILPDMSREMQLRQQGYSHIVGVDEVGRGCLAGPVVVAAVQFGLTHKPIEGITDSKKLTSSKREFLAEMIMTQAEKVNLALCEVDLIEELNILQATKYAMSQAIVPLECQVVLIDGRDIPEVSAEKVEAIISGDRVCYSIAAASIVAKVYRDQLMAQLHQQYPVYDWCNNKGYGTQKHRLALKQFGPTPHHRKLFIRKVMV